MSDIKVMISSTALDLPEHRKEVMDACLRQGMFPTMMEHLPAGDADAIAESLRMVDEANIYLGVFAHRYGYVPKGYDISITEMEYDRAVERGIPRLLFLMHDDHPVKASDVEKGEDAVKLEKFKARLMTERVVNFFKSPADLRAGVIDGLSHYRERKESEPNLEWQVALTYVGLRDDVFYCYEHVDYQAAIVEVRNRPAQDRTPPSFDRVKAQITYYDKDDNKAAYINAGNWITQEQSVVPLHVGESWQLIIALRTLEPGYLLAVQNNRPDTAPETNILIPLRDEEYGVGIDLIDLDRGKLIGVFPVKIAQRAYSPKLTIEKKTVRHK